MGRLRMMTPYTREGSRTMAEMMSSSTVETCLTVYFQGFSSSSLLSSLSCSSLVRPTFTINGFNSEQFSPSYHSKPLLEHQQDSCTSQESAQIRPRYQNAYQTASHTFSHSLLVSGSEPANKGQCISNNRIFGTQA